MNEEFFYYEGNRFLIDNGVLKDVQVDSEVVYIPESVTEIRRQAFLDARLLGRMKLLVIPSSVKKMERLSFAGMANLKMVEVHAAIATLEQGMFRNCMDLEYISLPATIRSIECRAFENCLKLRSVEIPKTWVRVAEDAFFNCVNLKDSRIDKAVEDAQYRRKKEEEEARKARFPHLYQEKTKQKPEPVDELPVVEIPVQEEKSAAEELLEAELAAESAMEHISVGFSAQPVQEETTEAHFCIHDGILERCEVYSKSIKIPEGVTALADRVFYGMYELEEILFPSTLSYIGVQALEGTGWLAREREKSNYVVVNGILISAFYNSMVIEAKLPDHIYRIAPYAFFGSGAQLVVLPESVREVDARAFVECEVTEIDFSPKGDVVFHVPLAVRCGKLKELYFQGKTPRLEENFVEDCPALKRVCLKWAQTVVANNAFRDTVRIWVL